MKRKLLPVLGVLAASAGPLTAQTNEAADIRKELDALRNDYEARINRLENRIRELEGEKTAPAKPSVEKQETVKKQTPRKPAPRGETPETANPKHQPQPQQLADADSDNTAANREERRKKAAGQFEETTEIRQLSLRNAKDNLLAERIEDVLEGYLDITGYFRAGYGRANEGGSQAAFGIPGVAKYRLGNEAENYGELAFSKTFYPAGFFSKSAHQSADDPIAHMVYRLAFVDSYKDYGTASDTDFMSPELWGSLANVIPGMPNAKVWAGNRFYRRHDIHINDFYFWDMSGGGGGIEDIQVPGGKLALAWIGDGARSSIYSQIGTPDPDNLAGFSKTSIDLRYYDWKFLGGEGELGLVYSSAESGVDENGNHAGDTDGLAISLVRTDQGFLDKNSLHKLSLQYGTGPAKTFTSGFETFSNSVGTYIRPDSNESWRFRATDQIVVKPWDHLSIGSALVYQYTDFGDNAPSQEWVSAGVRPIWHLTDHFNIAFEGGVDYVSNALNGTGDGGTITKFTIAPEVSLGGDFFSRPVLRAFLTYSSWSNDLVGFIGGPDYADADSGWTWGMQMETWW